jgi:hypothetical protein
MAAIVACAGLRSRMGVVQLLLAEVPQIAWNEICVA